jgi:hypothetical protein
MYETRNETTNPGPYACGRRARPPLLDSAPAAPSPGQCAGPTRGLELDRAKFAPVQGRPLRRSGRWCVRLRTGVNEGELQLELQQP